MDELTGQPTRRRILALVEERPGLSGRDVQRQLGLGWGETAYHLERLVKGGGLHRERGGARDYYFARSVTWEDRRLFQALRSPTERQIALALLEESPRSFSVLTAAAGVGKSTLSYHLGRLEALGAIEPVVVDGQRRFRLARPERVGQLLRSYSTTFADRLVDDFVSSLSGLFEA